MYLSLLGSAVRLAAQIGALVCYFCVRLTCLFLNVRMKTTGRRKLEKEGEYRCAKGGKISSLMTINFVASIPRSASGLETVVERAHTQRAMLGSGHNRRRRAVLAGRQHRELDTRGSLVPPQATDRITALNHLVREGKDVVFSSEALGPPPALLLLRRFALGVELLRCVWARLGSSANYSS
nr:hypothetical protein Iba_chr10fCG5840 [Ipomoea batatas]